MDRLTGYPVRRPITESHEKIKLKYISERIKRSGKHLKYRRHGSITGFHHLTTEHLNNKNLRDRKILHKIKSIDKQ